MPLRVGQILYSGLGGHGSVAFSLLHAAKRRNAWVGHMFFIGVEQTLPEYENLCAQGGVPYQSIRTTAGQAWRSWLRLFRMLRQHRSDVLVLHSVKFILPCWIYARLHGVCLVVVEHQPNQLKSRIEWLVSRALMLLADAVVVISPQYKQELQDNLGMFFCARKVYLIPNGIDTDKFRPSKKTLLSNRSRIVVGMAARFSNTKRQEVLVRAIQILRNQSDTDWRLSLAGDGEKYPEILKLVSDAGLSDVVELTGYLGESELLDWFSRVDIYAHASDGETLSTSLLQAMAMGLPILGSDVKGIDNLLEGEDGCGLLVSNDAEGFAAEIVRLTVDQALAESLGSSARDRAIDEFSHETMFRNYEELLACVCKQ